MKKTGDGQTFLVEYLKEIRICKADPISPSLQEEISNYSIIINDVLPTNMELVEAEKFYEFQATMIEDALFNSLPQGTYDRLGIKFMQRKVSLYRGRTA